MLHQESVYLQRHNDVYKVACSGESYFLQMSLHRNSNANSKLARFEELFVQQLKLASSFYHQSGQWGS